MNGSPVRALRIVLLGPPASGKGTQGKRLASELNLGYLSTGALLREHVGAGTTLGRLAKPILDRGAYLPDDLMCRILAEWLSAQGGGWVLDGFPRSVPQAEFLDSWLAERDLKLDAALALEVPFGELLSRVLHRVECPECRWSGQSHQAGADNQCPACPSPVVPRADDNEENFTQRHAEFERLTRPVIDRYQELDLLFRCDATAPQDEVAGMLLRHFLPETPEFSVSGFDF